MAVKQTNIVFAQHDSSLGQLRNDRLTTLHSKDNLALLRKLKLEKKLTVHNGCVNTICWNESGEYLLSGSDDRRLVISNPFANTALAEIQTGHRSNIFSAKFLSQNCDNLVVSCSADGMIYVSDVVRQCSMSALGCHKGTVYELLTLPQEPHTFLSCGEDGTVRLFDIREQHSCSHTPCEDFVAIQCQRAVSSIAANELVPHQLALGSADGYIRLYDRRMLSCFATNPATDGLQNQFIAPAVKSKNRRITSLEFSPDGEELLVSYTSEQLYLFNLKQQDSKYAGNCSKSLAIDDDNATCEEAEHTDEPLLIQKLRFRGDWSDTGPNSRPQNMRTDNAPDNDRRDVLMQRMSLMMTRWLATRLEQQQEAGTADDHETTEASATEQHQQAAVTGGDTSSANSDTVSATLVAQSSEDVTAASSRRFDNSLRLDDASSDATNEAESEISKKMAAIRIQEAFRKRREQKRAENSQPAVVDYQPKLQQMYSGHRNCRTMIKEATFWGTKYVMSGSDCGHIFVWDRATGRLVNLLEGDKHVVNCLRPHPVFPILASSGIDYDIKLWTCFGEDDCFDESRITEIVNRNRRMLVETQNTVTVPASFMLRILASLNRS